MENTFYESGANEEWTRSGIITDQIVFIHSAWLQVLMWGSWRPINQSDIHCRCRFQLSQYSTRVKCLSWTNFISMLQSHCSISFHWLQVFVMGKTFSRDAGESRHQLHDWYILSGSRAKSFLFSILRNIDKKCVILCHFPISIFIILVSIISIQNSPRENKRMLKMLCGHQFTFTTRQVDWCLAQF